MRWTSLALKVFVARKHDPPAAGDRVPRRVTLGLGSGPAARSRHLRVDVVALGSRQAPRSMALQANDATAWLGTGVAGPGHRFVFGAPAPGAPAPGGLEVGFRWRIGTTGGVADVGQRRYVVTAGHVVADVYRDQAAFPTIPGSIFQLGFAREHVQRCENRDAMQIIPQDPLTESGETMDAVAIALPAAIPIPASLPRWAVADSADLFSFVGREAFVLVERDGKPTKLRGEIEAVKLAHAETLESDSGTRTFAFRRR